MSPNSKSRRAKTIAPSDIYTIILVLAFCVVLATSALVAYKCYCQYDTIFKIPKRSMSRLGSLKYHTQLTIDKLAAYRIRIVS